MLRIFRTRKDGRHGAPHRIATLGTSALLLVGFIPATAVLTAAPASAAQSTPDESGDISGTDAAGEDRSVSNAEKDATKYNKTADPKKPNPTKGGTVDTIVDPTLVGTDYYPFEAWFYEPDKLGLSPMVPLKNVTFDGMAAQDCTANPAADRSYPYDGNGIPVPNAPGAARETRLVWVSNTWVIEHHKETYKNTETYVVYKTDPVTGQTVVTKETVTFPDETKTWDEVTRNISCKYQTAPGWSKNDCVVYGDMRINGPYDQSWKPMESTEVGGTNTRVPDPGTGKIGTDGMLYSQVSEPLGYDMQAAGLKPAKNYAPSPTQVWPDCVPTSDNKFSDTKTERIGSLGRYTAIIHNWRTRVWYMKFSTLNWENVYKGTAAKMSTAPNSPYHKVGGAGYELLDIGKPWMQTTYDYFKVICKSGTSPNGRVSIVDVSNGVTGGRDSVNWGDSNPSYYSWNCGDGANTGGGTDHDPTNDFLQCDRYGQKATAPYQYDRLDYTYHSEAYTVGVSDGWAECGGPCGSGEWTSCTYYPDRGTYGCSWGHYETRYRDVRNATPAGYEDNGSYWFKKAAPPEGWTDTGSGYETTKFQNITVDNKSAAPIISAAELVNGKAVALEYKNGAYRLGSAADPVHFEWTRIRINTLGGENINTAGKNVQWEYKYALAPWSSPMLKGANVNDLRQPYHGWVDSTPTTVDAGEIPLDTKWEPDKFYEYKTIPYTFTYLPYTYHTETAFSPRQVTTREWDSYDHVDWRYWWGSGGADCGTWGNGDPWCREPVYAWRHHSETVVAPPPAGCYDDGSQYVCPVQVKDPAPEGYVDNGQKYQSKNPAPYGYVDNGNDGYTTKDVVNDSGRTGGIAFDKWRSWPTDSGLEDCTINMSNYSSDLSGSYKIKCGDNVTENTRAAYFRYFMSSTANSQGWQVTPWARVTADVQTDFSEINGFHLNPDGTASMTTGGVTSKWVRQSYDCPAQPVRIIIDRVVN